jgi:hypothetical protein
LALTVQHLSATFAVALDAQSNAHDITATELLSHFGVMYFITLVPSNNATGIIPFDCKA